MRWMLLHMIARRMEHLTGDAWEEQMELFFIVSEYGEDEDTDMLLLFMNHEGVEDVIPPKVVSNISGIPTRLPQQRN